MLEIHKIGKKFGGVQALNDVSFSFKEGEFLGLIGPNGSGKTTLFNVMSGVYKPTSGRVMFRGNNITGLLPDKICHSGIARTFQIPKPICSLSVLDNVCLGLAFGDTKNEKNDNEKELKYHASKLLQFVGLDVDFSMTPSKMTAGDLRKLELARALATNPRLLLADEVLSGLNQEELKEATLVLKRIRDELGISIIWVEHIMGALMSLVDRVVVLSYGALIAEGTPKEISNDKTVIEAYLGED